MQYLLMVLLRNFKPRDESTMKESYTSKRRVRRSFGKIDAVSDMPSLIEVQTGSYASFIEQDKNAEPCEFGLEEVFKSIFPIKDFSGNGELEFVKYELDEFFHQFIGIFWLFEVNADWFSFFVNFELHFVAVEVDGSCREAFFAQCFGNRI